MWYGLHSAGSGWMESGTGSCDVPGLIATHSCCIAKRKEEVEGVMSLESDACKLKEAVSAL